MTKLAAPFCKFANAPKKREEGFQPCDVVVFILGDSKTGNRDCSNSFIYKSEVGFVTRTGTYLKITVLYW
jgi:hypothetical protein